MFFKIDRNSPIPIYKQIFANIKSLIDQGLVEFNKPLPSTRKLADKLGVSRYTVCRVYEELQILGYLKSSQGSYNIVLKRKKEATYNPEKRSIISWEKVSNQATEELFESYLNNLADIPTRSNNKNDSFINLSELQLDPKLFPIDNFRRSMNHVLLRQGVESLDFCHPEGNKLLREYISERLRLHGISTYTDEILITYGSQQALDLIIRFFARPDKKVIIEAPTYFNIIPLLKFNNLDILTVPMNHDGMDLDCLENILNEQSVSFLYTIPNFQNPTGITTSHYHRERLINLCMQHEVVILEDGFEEEMKYFGKFPLPIKSIDEKNIVIYLGTFSKILFPGVRIGWINADKDCIKRLTAIKRSSDLRCGNLIQSALYDFCKRGYYDLHIKRLHWKFRKRMEIALETMEECFPDTVSWTCPSGGYSIWIKSPKKLSPEYLHEFMSQYGVIVSPGGYYFPDQGSSKYFRVSIARIDEAEIREGISRIGKALHRMSQEI